MPNPECTLDYSVYENRYSDKCWMVRVDTGESVIPPMPPIEEWLAQYEEELKKLESTDIFQIVTDPGVGRWIEVPEIHNKIEVIPGVWIYTHGILYDGIPIQ